MAKENRKTINVEGFNRVERDDRLLDVFPKETIEKGVEIWEKWTGDQVEIMRIHNDTHITKHVFSREEIESALKNNIRLALS